jgi:hypothetical protein
MRTKLYGDDTMRSTLIVIQRYADAKIHRLLLEARIQAEAGAVAVLDVLRKTRFDAVTIDLELLSDSESEF